MAKTLRNGGKMQQLKVVMYHYVRDLKNSRYPGIKGLSLEKFKGQIEYLHTHYHIVRVEDVIASYDGGRQLPEDAMLLTFDDGYVDHFTNVFPILDRYGIQGSFYIPAKTFAENKLLDVNKIHFILASADIDRLLPDLLERMDHYRGAEFDFPSNEELFETFAVANRFDPKEVIFVKRILQNGLPERLRHIISSELFERYVGIPEDKFARELYMNEEQVACLKRHGMYIGVHGYDHYWLGKLTKAEMEQDLTKALTAMDPFIDRNSWAMNYPYGSEGAYNEDVLAFLRANGCRVGFTTKAETADLNVCDRLLIPRYDTNDFPTEA